MDTMTKDRIMALVGANSDEELAKWWTEQAGSPVTRQAVHKWGRREGGRLPEIRQWQLRVLIEAGKITLP